MNFGVSLPASRTCARFPVTERARTHAHRAHARQKSTVVTAQCHVGNPPEGITSAFPFCSHCMLASLACICRFPRVRSVSRTSWAPSDRIACDVRVLCSACTHTHRLGAQCRFQSRAIYLCVHTTALPPLLCWALISSSAVGSVYSSPLSVYSALPSTKGGRRPVFTTTGPEKYERACATQRCVCRHARPPPPPRSQRMHARKPQRVHGTGRSVGPALPLQRWRTWMRVLDDASISEMVANPLRSPAMEVTLLHALVLLL